MTVAGYQNHIWTFSLLPAFAAFGLLFYIFASALISRANVPRGLPWVGGRDRAPFSELRAAIRCALRPRESSAEGYEKYLREGQSYVFPMLNKASEIIIPNDKLRWLLDHPDSDSSVSEAHFDMLAGQYAFTDPEILRHPFHEHVIHRNLARKLTELIPSTWAEVKYQTDEALNSNSDEWQEICVFKKLTTMVAGISNRMLVGLPLCRNTNFRDLNAKFAAGVIFVMTVRQLCPRFLLPLAGHLAAIPNRIFVWQSKKHTLSVIKQRIAEIEYVKAHPTALDKPEIPEDYLTWQFRLARELGLEKECDPDWIARRIMPLEFAAIHTTSFTITNVLFDLLGSDPSLGYIDAIREEAERVMIEEKGVWSKQAFAKMVRTDSAIRESMRVSGFANRGVHRKVLAQDGLKGEEGWTAPFGSMIATDVWMRQHDPAIYPDPYRYDAFRFSRMREAAIEKGSSEQYLLAQNLTLISTGDAFLPWGHGRHSCPGRFFINVELKLLLAYLFMNYEFQYLPERPPNTVMGDFITPPMQATVKVRRRPHSSDH